MGILKAGGAYVPLDPAYPQERLNFILEDAQVPVLLTQERLVKVLPDHQARVVCLDAGWGAISRESQENLVSVVQPDSLAYVIYTSGSTGKPKGVMITHQSVVNHNFAIARQLALQPSDRVLQFASLSFDVAVEEFFPSWLSGATVILATTRLPSGDGFLPLIEQEQLSVLNLPAPYWHGWVKQLSLTNIQLPDSLRLVIVGSEKILAEWFKVWQHLGGKSVCWLNAYGTTESTITTSLYKPGLSFNPLQTRSEMPIGRPIANTQLYILDVHLQPVPVGVPGELYIGGAGLARGYLNQPDLTEAAFISHPFSQKPGARLYKTGDLCRYLSDGNIEYLGRLDHQVKIRGFRIELGEIETVLGQHPAVQQVVVLAREDMPGNRRLVAYVVPGGELVTNELRRFLQQKLPEYMVPSAFMILNALPLTPNGKVDRRALPAPEQQRPENESSFVAARTDTEQKLALLWAEVLGIEIVGTYSNFFELGGHSLLAAQLMSRVQATFKVEVPLRALFEHPTLAALAEVIEALRQQNQAQEVPPLFPILRTNDLPLSFAQQRLWFLDQLQPGTAFYNISAALNIRGHLNVEALKHSLNTINQRHEALRTTFTMVDGHPIQVIAATLNLTLPVIDLQGLFDAQQADEIQRLAKEEAQQPFCLAQGPLVRATLLQLAETEHVMLLTMHHIVSDGWSIGIFLREFVTLYAAFGASKPSPLAPLPIQYVDFAVWQRQWLQGEVLDAQLSYWQQQLEGAPSLLELPTDRPRPAVQSFQGATQSLKLSKPMVEALTALSQRQGVTLFMTLLAAFQTLLYRYTAQEDVLVGTPIANRNRAEVEGLIGCFVNTLVLRTNLSSNPTFQELLKRVREVALGAYAHQDLPFEQLVDALQPERELSRSPLFQVMFVLQNNPTPVLDLEGLMLAPVAVETDTAKFDLTLSIEETGPGLSATLEYNTDLFDAATISRMAGHFQTLLEGIVADPSQQLSQLPLLTPAEHHQLLVEWNNTQVEYPQDLCIHQLFEAQVERTPDAVAVVYENQQLAYQELNQKANQLAHYLQQQGVGPETLVGICMERSLEMVVGLLGILKAGGAYVPIDPSYPKERLSFMLQDAQVPVLLTQQHLLTEKLPDYLGSSLLTPHPSPFTTICLDTYWNDTAQECLENPTSPVSPKNLAYVIYTSGSTGTPKGAMNSHRGIGNRLLWMQDTYQLTATDRVLQKTPFSFDVSVWEFFWPLITGACLVVARPEGHKDSAYLVKLIAQQQITTLHFVPSVLWVFLAEQGLETCSCLKRVLCSGEALPFELQDQFFARLNAELHNLYGPTEAAIDVTFWACERSRQRQTVPIGRPIANTQLYILDVHLQPVPVGVPGELYIGGAGLARGYLNQPDLTEAAFISHPFSQEPGARLYKTGDLCRYLPDGNIEYLGRLDHQVKIRGFRIELGEIEAVLTQHLAVQQAVVMAGEDVPGDKRLVAYIVPHQAHTPSISELRRFLQHKLPEYMVPAAFMLLNALPLTPNGKVDRRALPAPEQQRLEQESSFVAPRDFLEFQLTQLWESILRFKPIGVTENFFDLGGHSLLAVGLMAQIHEQFEQSLPVSTLYTSPTVEQLADLLRQRPDTRTWSPLVPIQPHGSQRPFFCVHPVGGNVLCYVDLARSLGPEQPFYGLQARGLEGQHTPRAQVEVIAAEYIEAMLLVQPQGPYLLGGWSMGGVIAFEMAQQLHQQGQTVALLALLDSWVPAYARQDSGKDMNSPALLAQFAIDLGGRLGKNLPVVEADLRQLNPEEQLNFILELVKRFGVVPSGMEQVQMNQLLTVYKANLQALMCYVPQMYPSQMTLLSASEALPEDLDDPTLGWAKLTAEPVEVHLLPGNHYSMLATPHVQALSEQLKRCFKRVQRAEHPQPPA